MADSLRRLVNIQTFTSLQDKLEKWLEDYHINSCDQNVARCCDIIELNSRVQGQLFKLLNITASEGGTYGGAATIKGRLLPWLSQGLISTGSILTSDTSLNVLAESAAKDREINELQDMYERSLQNLETDLATTKEDAEILTKELNETKDELDNMKRASTSEKMFNETEIKDLKSKLRSAEETLASYRKRVGMVDDYEHTVRRLRDDVAFLTGTRKVLVTNGDLGESLSTYRYLPRPMSPLAIDDVTQRVRQQNLITRFNDMFSQDRLDAMDILRRYSDDHENNQRIVNVVLQESFASAKLSFRDFKMKVRANLAATHVGPETLEEGVQDYINRNTDMFNLPSLIDDVIRALNRNPKIFLPPGVTYDVISPFIREVVRLAWQMSALAHPLDVASATDAELFDENKYRRSYDSEFTAPLVNHHIWPCLVQGTRVIMKGEAMTRRGASLGSPIRSRSPARSLSPSRALSPNRSLVGSRARSRSPSPRRSPTGGRTGSRMSTSPSRANTASTSLSHYMS